MSEKWDARDPDAVIGVAATNVKMPCGCYGDLRQGNTGMTYLVTAEAFLCKARHKQGEVVPAVSGEVER